MNIYQSNTYRKDFSWLDFVNESRVQEREQMKDQKYYISVFEVYLTILSSNFWYQPRCEISIPHIGVVNSQRYRAISGGENFIEKIKASIFMEAVLAKEIM